MATSIKSMNPYGVVTSCGNVASPELPINVYPFILRGVTLVGIDSQNCPMPTRVKAWEKLANEWKIPMMDGIVAEIDLTQLNQSIDDMLNRRHKGRKIVRMLD